VIFCVYSSLTLNDVEVHDVSLYHQLRHSSADIEFYNVVFVCCSHTSSYSPKFINYLVNLIQPLPTIYNDVDDDVIIILPHAFKYVYSGAIDRSLSLSIFLGISRIAYTEKFFF